MRASVAPPSDRRDPASVALPTVRPREADSRDDSRVVSLPEARRIAVRAQALDGSATGVEETIRRLGYLQLDPIASVAPAQHLVLWSRLGSAYDPAELDRLLAEKRLYEWNAFLWPAEDLPVLKALEVVRAAWAAEQRHVV